MGVFLHQDAVVVRAGFGLIRVDTQVDRPRVILREEGPLEAAREAGAAAPAQPAVLHLRDDVERLLVFQRTLDRLVAAVRAVAFQLVAVGLVDARQEYRFVWHFAVSSVRLTGHLDQYLGQVA